MKVWTGSFKLKVAAARERTTIPGVGTHEPVLPRSKMEANRWSYAEVVSNGKPEGVGPKTPSVFQTHQDLGTLLVCAQSRYAGGHGSSSSAKGASVLGEASESGRVNISNPSKIPAIGISTGGEGACGHISTEKCTREARRNDDTVVNSLRMDVDRGGRSRESEGSLAGLGRGPGCRLSDEEDGPSLAPVFYLSVASRVGSRLRIGDLSHCLSPGKWGSCVVGLNASDPVRLVGSLLLVLQSLLVSVSVVG
ncbi:hypothetical protein Ancab_031698 [Ancistrocladus abbreviatus]